MPTISESDQSLPAPAPGARAAVALLLSINLFNYLDRYVLAAVEPKISETFFGSHDEHALAKMGSLATAFVLSYMLAAPIFGWLADRMSRWLLVGIGVGVWSLASGASGLASTFGLLLITRMFVGIGEAGYGPAAPTIIADLYPVERRGSVLAWFYVAIPVGSALGYTWGGVIASFLDWRWAFYTVVPPGLLLTFLALRKKDSRTADPNQPRPERSKASLADYLSLLRNRSFMLDCAGMTAMTFAIGGISFWMPRYIAEYRHAGTLASVNFTFGVITATAGIFATLSGGWVGDRLRSKFSGSYFLVSGAGMLIACPFVIAMLYLPFPAAWVAIFFAVFFLFFNTGPSNTILANVTRPTIRATAFAFNIFLIHALGDAVSPPIVGWLVGQKERWNLAFYVVAGVMVLAAILWTVGAQFLAEDTAAAESPERGGRGFEVVRP